MAYWPEGLRSLVKSGLEALVMRCKFGRLFLRSFIASAAVDAEAAGFPQDQWKRPTCGFPLTDEDTAALGVWSYLLIAAGFCDEPLSASGLISPDCKDFIVRCGEVEVRELLARLLSLVVSSSLQMIS